MVHLTALDIKIDSMHVACNEGVSTEDRQSVITKASTMDKFSDAYPMSSISLRHSMSPSSMCPSLSIIRLRYCRRL